MRNSEFVALVIANASKTRNVRAYIGPWYSGASRLPDAVTRQIGCVIALLQAKIDQGYFCKPDQTLLIYNFQIISTSDENIYCSLDTLIKPRIVEAADLADKTGTQFSLVVNGTTGEVMNNTKAMLAIGAMTPEEVAEEGLEPVQSYGDYHDYRPLCCFVALASYRPIDDLQPLFSGQYDTSEMVQQSQAFDSLSEALALLKEKEALGKYVAELICSKEDLPHAKQMGLGKQIIKIFNYANAKVAITPLPETQRKEAFPEKEAEQTGFAIAETKSS